MSQSNRNFKGIWIPASLWLSKEFTSQEKIMLAEIDSLDNESGCFASNAYFAEFFGLSERRVREIISELSRKGAIKTKQVRQARIIKVEDSFRLRWNIPAKVGGDKLPPYNKGSYSKEDNKATLATARSGKESTNPKQKASVAEKEEGAAAFDAFWASYPRKVSKGAARKAFAKAIKNTELSVMLEAVKAHKECVDWTKENGKYIPHPSTWLNGERWEDELESGSTDIDLDKI